MSGVLQQVQVSNELCVIRTSRIDSLLSDYLDLSVSRMNPVT